MPIEGSGPPQADSAGLAVLDHQDLRLGPVAYDVASLLNDSLFPPAAVEAALLKRSGAPELDYRRAAVQRTLKAVGTYAAFAERGARRHLPLIRPTLRRTLFHMRQLPELEGLAQRLTKDWNA